MSFIGIFNQLEAFNKQIIVNFIKTHVIRLKNKRSNKNNYILVPSKGSTRSQIGQKWSKMSKNEDLMYFLFIKCNYSILFMISVRAHNIMTYFNQKKQNNQNWIPYKWSTRPQKGQKWGKISQKWCFSVFFGHQMQLYCLLFIISIRTHNNMI